MRRLICAVAVLLALCVPVQAREIHDGVKSGVAKVPACVARRFSAEGRVVRVTDGRIEVKGTLIREPYNVIGFCYVNGDIYISTHWDYSDAYFEYVVLHEFGHYLDFSTRSCEWNKEEGERFADSFADYILHPEALLADDPAIYVEIERRLHEMKN